MSKDAPEYFAVEAEYRDIAIVASRYNGKLVDALLESVLETLTASGAKAENIEVVRVPGANEIPYAASMMARSDDYAVIIALGVVIAGQTDHHTIIGQSTSQALQAISINHEIPVINGIIVVNSLQQAEERVLGEYKRGIDFARAALEMAQVAEVLDDRVIGEGFDMTDEDIDALIEWTEEDDPEDWKK